MRKKFFTLTLLFAVLFFFTAATLEAKNAETKKQDFIKPPETIINENVPPIPIEIKKRMQQYSDLKSASFSDWDPRGQGMIISTRLGNTNQLYWVSKPMEKFKQLTDFDEPVYSAVFSPDPERKYFLFSKDVGGAENYQFFRYDLDTGKSTMITDGKHRHMSILFNRKGDRIAYMSNSRTGKVFDIYFMDPLKPEEAKLVYKGQLGYYIPTAWFEDGKHLLVVRYISANSAQSYILNIETGQIENITPKSESLVFFALYIVSPDGKTVYGVTDLNSEFKHIIKMDLESGKIETITKDINWDIQEADVTEDFKKAVFVANEGGISRLYLMDLQTGKYEPISQIPQGIIGGVKFDKKGKKLALSLNNPRMNGDVFHFDLETKEFVRWTKSDTAGLDTSKFVQPEVFYYSTFDKENKEQRKIPCFYFKPKKKTDALLPVIVYIHGGPEFQYRPYFSNSLSYFINELGIAVLAPNVRGSAGYGKTYLLLDNAKKREDSVKDIGALLDWIATRPELNKEKVGVFGGSYGGYMVLASMVLFSDRLACGVDIVGISNFVTFLKNTADYRRDLRRAEYGDERKIGEFLNKISPTTNAHKINKPLFVIQGKNDPRVPAGEAVQIVETVRKNNVPVWYQLATNEGHGFSKKYNRDFMVYSIVRFFQEYLLK